MGNTIQLNESDVIIKRARAQYKSKISKNVGLDDETQEKLVTLTQSSKWNKKTLVKYLVNLCMEFRFDRDGWKSKIIEAMEQVERNRFQSLDNACVKRAWIRGAWRCLKSSKTGTVKITLLGPTEDDADNACKACSADQNLEERWKEHLANDKKGIYEKHTYCRKGGQFDDKTGRVHCVPQRLWQNQNRCFTMAKGSPCPDLKTLSARKIKKTGIRRRK